MGYLELCERSGTDLDVLDLSSVHQLTFQNLQTLRSQHHHTLKHLKRPKHNIWYSHTIAHVADTNPS